MSWDASKVTLHPACTLYLLRFLSPLNPEMPSLEGDAVRLFSPKELTFGFALLHQGKGKLPRFVSEGAWLRWAASRASHSRLTWSWQEG